MSAITPTHTSAGRNHRARWAAIGAAIAVSLGAGGFGIANAVVSTNPKNVYVAIAPCRLIDTRPAPDNVGPRATPLGTAETATFAGTGDVAGPCNIPAGISAIQTNVTAVGATAGSFLTFFPSDIARPTTASLNPTPGEPPTPNAVTINLPAAGTFNLYNHAGTVDVIIDIVGYYDNHNHSTADITNEPGISFNFKAAPTSINAANVVVNSTAIRVPSDGFLNIQATGSFEPLGIGGAMARCQLTLGSATIDTGAANSFVASTDSLPTTLSMHRTVPITAANNPLFFNTGQTVRLVCSEEFGDPNVRNVELTATFYSTEYEPAGLIVIPFPLTEELDGNAGGG